MKLLGVFLINLSKAFVWIPHNLLIVKLSTYEFEKTALKYIYSLISQQKATACENKQCIEWF